MSSLKTNEADTTYCFRSVERCQIKYSPKDLIIFQIKVLLVQWQAAMALFPNFLYFFLKEGALQQAIQSQL